MNLQFYSNPAFNPEENADLRQHNVLLYDAARDLSVLGFEDDHRDDGSGSDEDFNDVMFYVTSNPASAIMDAELSTLTYTGDDSDEDGVNDPVDDYPEDPSRAYDNYFPSQNIFGCLAFEDLWPYQGDYDFNDLVLNYHFTEILNADNQIVQLDATFVLRAVGASFENGFGFELGVSPSVIESVTGLSLSGQEIFLDPNGVEADQDLAVIVVFDQTTPLMNRPAGYYVNTQNEAPYILPDTLNVSVLFTEPIDSQILGMPPYNPFIFVNQNREREVHLAGDPPTSIAAGSAYFDSGDDASTEAGYYKTSNNLPWALDIVEPLAYPLEKITIDNAHLFFVGWAQTSGMDYSDWYKDNTGYRNTVNIYNN